MADFNLKSYLAAKHELVDERLRRLLASHTVESDLLAEAMAYSLMAGGKRLRPILLLAAHEIFSPQGDYALDAACALEMLHTYSLIHDDLPCFDDDDTRRGAPTCHVRYGEWMAVLAGDTLCTLAFEVLAGGADDVSPELKLQTTRIVAAAAGARGMARGQAMDMALEGRRASEDEVLLMQRLKTGRLLEAAIAAGALLGGADEPQRELLNRFGALVGQAFQIKDDLLDIEGSTETIGKTAGKDESSGKATLPALIGVEQAQKRAGTLIDEAVDILRSFVPGAEPLRALAQYLVARRR